MALPPGPLVLAPLMSPVLARASLSARAPGLVLEMAPAPSAAVAATAPATRPPSACMHQPQARSSSQQWHLHHKRRQAPELHLQADPGKINLHSAGQLLTRRFRNCLGSPERVICGS